MDHRMQGLVVLATATALVVAGCGSGSKDTATSPTPEAPSALRIKDKGETAKGGTVYVLMTQDFQSLDPADNYYSDGELASRLIYRALTFVKDTPGEELSIKPDLVESLGTPSDDMRTWTYKLREGLKYEDGTPITAKDVKYGVQRSFASDVYPQGATWMVDLLANDTGYAGPYATPGKDLTSVETPDERTLVFHFKGPQPDADWIMSLPYASPVPKARDTKQDYGRRPIASGPYKIDEYTRDGRLILVRNEQWSAATDPNRPAYPDRFEFTLNLGDKDVDQRLLDGAGNDAYAVPESQQLPPDALAGILNSPVEDRLINGPTPCVYYAAINTEKIKDVDVRHAIALAIDREGLQAINGGVAFGSIARSIIPPSVPGFVAPDLGLKPTGDPEAAKKLLVGKTVAPLHLSISESATVGMDAAKQIQSNLKAVGLELVVDRVPDDAPAKEGDDAPELTNYDQWCFDWPTPASVVDPVLGTDAENAAAGPSNVSRYFDPKYSREIRDLASSTESKDAIDAKYVKLANEIQTTAWPLLPTILYNDPLLVGGNVTNVGISPMFGGPDLNTLAVKK